MLRCEGKVDAQKTANAAVYASFFDKRGDALCLLTK